MVPVSCKATRVSTNLRAECFVDHLFYRMQTSRQLNPDRIKILPLFSIIFLLCRNLSKPIAVQYKEKEDRYVDTYKVGLIFPYILINENWSFVL